ncbi:hypothetical protein Nepgr_011481 [Nepenthes gracilis]|uniref:Uncharacterized protein n=1 Tax=Nepenthes gracilis TaxID=150966 RepID=A0AAD3SF87_NEPGR|nr:hypothetical protein Nepgr_011481 [Nepenthes gracilis]
MIGREPPTPNGKVETPWIKAYELLCMGHHLCGSDQPIHPEDSIDLNISGGIRSLLETMISIRVICNLKHYIHQKQTPMSGYKG